LNLLNLKIEKSLQIIREALQSFSKVAVIWSTGKDSTVVLYLTRQLDPNIMVFFGDTTQKFKETYDFRDRMAKEWNLNLINMVPDVTYEEVKGERERCCHHLKTLPAVKFLVKFTIDAALVGIRWDEHPARANEDYFSQRPHCCRVHPILHWTEKDIWAFIKQNKIPYNPLYDRGYRSIGCAPCTIPAPPEAPERSGRAKDKEEIMERLRSLGYW